MKPDTFIFDIDYFQKFKHGNIIPGDIFLIKKNQNNDRIIIVLADGLGSGIKANVLAVLTSTMVSEFMMNNYNIQKTAEIIMKTLPVCKIRKINYSTFTIIDITTDNNVKIIEFDNPAFLLFKNNCVVDIQKKKIEILANGRKNIFYFSDFKLETEDRIVIFSDGVSQSGMGMPGFSFGWKYNMIIDFISDILKNNPCISSREISKKIIEKSLENDMFEAKDDITCGSVYLRKPRKLFLVTGPSVDKNNDALMAKKISDFSGKKIICGGSTANLIARELNKEIKIDLTSRSPDLPPAAIISGIDLVTEGILTLSKVSELLSSDFYFENSNKNPAAMICEMLLDSDLIYFLIGTKINEAHQNPNISVDLEIRRTIIKKIAKILEEKFLKKIIVEFI